YSSDLFDSGLTDQFSSILFGVNRGITDPYSKVNTSDINRFFRSRKIKKIEIDDSIVNPQIIADEFADFLNIQIRTRRIREQRFKTDFQGEKHLLLDNLSMHNVEISLVERYQYERKTRLERVQKALFETLAIVVEKGYTNTDMIPSDFHTKLIEYRVTLLEVLIQLPENELSSKIIDMLKQNSEGKGYLGNFNIFEGKWLLANLVYNMIGELEKEKEKVALYSVSQLVEIFNEFLSRNKKLVISDRGAKISTEDGTLIELGELSSG
ncbi:hypothetical protein P4V64_30685, partial [Bacillus thuringiensis]|nr:hypothetical protein [Bacillus thuringiensis]